MFKDQYVKATHYFGECSMGNFWNTFEKNKVESDFEIIKLHGFNTIILILPWSPFQTKIDPITYDQELLNRLSFICSIIKLQNFNLILRVGYLWSNSTENINTFERYRKFFINKKLQHSWVDYIKTIENIVASFNINYKFFLCWEDFYWSVLRCNENVTLENRLAIAKGCGFQDYLSASYSVEELNLIYKCNLNSLNEVVIPLFNEALFKELHFFFDNIYLLKIISLTKFALKHDDIVYEHRIDSDLSAIDGSLDSNYSKKHIKVDAIYYHPMIGEKSNKAFTAREAIDHFSKVVNSFRANSVQRGLPFIDQLNFHISNPQYPNFGRIKPEIHNDFLSGILPVLSSGTSGYGIWGIFDWTNDKVFNGAFELSLKGWESSFTEELDNTLILRDGATLFQKLKEPLKEAILEVKCTSKDDFLHFSVNGERFDEAAKLLIIKCKKLNEIDIQVYKGNLSIDKISVYNHVYSNGMLTRDRVERETSQLIKKINKNIN
ncbi:hypothetical protein DS885_05465 [Psychromonas sp. B3M02]|uniref:hypothetical protein n=1 Tax=Psychromonas sp. B3M02 TaxID=2267226 RepID=UPI000DE95A9D|nr:hypothetical protein [Psychromonas sp. B3M02]RBW46956.1 hypothetical protein DS885_05465 [Psychromonas sp. B3M02]